VENLSTAPTCKADGAAENLDKPAILSAAKNLAALRMTELPRRIATPEADS
jgi:hypothetical protein